MNRFELLKTLVKNIDEVQAEKTVYFIDAKYILEGVSMDGMTHNFEFNQHADKFAIATRAIDSLINFENFKLILVSRYENWFESWLEYKVVFAFHRTTRGDLE